MKRLGCRSRFTVAHEDSFTCEVNDEHRRGGLHSGSCRDRPDRDNRATSPAPGFADSHLMRSRAEGRGLRWLIGGFLFCPCHLPLTLAALGALLAGTAAGVSVREHGLAVGAVASALWILATWRGLRLLRSGQTSPTSCVRR